MDPRPVLLGIALSDHEVRIVRKPLWISLVIPRQRKLVVIPVRRADLKYRARGCRRLVLGRSASNSSRGKPTRGKISLFMRCLPLCQRCPLSASRSWPGFSWTVHETEAEDLPYLPFPAFCTLHSALCLPFQVACGWLVGGLWVPTAWLAVGLKLARMWLGVALPGFSRRQVRGSGFSMSILNTTAPSRLPRGGLGAPWTYPGPTLDP